jgi:hypothetical protein
MSDNAAPSTPPDVEARSADGRDETEAERLDRNWTEMLQELRVTQTGTQILTGFLLTLAFQPRFALLDTAQVDIYLGLVVLAALATVLGLAPVSLHRTLFHRHAKARLVALADRLLRASLIGVALLLSGTTLLIFDVVIGRTAGIVAAASSLIVTAALWVMIPWGARRARR